MLKQNPIGKSDSFEVGGRMADNDKKTGFSGFEDMVSDINIKPERKGATKPKRTDETVNDGATESQETKKTIPRKPKTTSPARNKSVPATPPSSDFSLSPGKVFFLILIVIFMISVFSGSKEEVPAPAADSTSPSTNYVPTPTTETPPTSSDPVLPNNDSNSWNEEIPPVSEAGHILTQAQVRYCLAEGVRIDGMKEILDNYSQSEIDNFNSYVNVMNKRCENSRYYISDKTKVDNQIESNRAKLKNDGAERLLKFRGLSSNTSSATNHSKNN